MGDAVQLRLDRRIHFLIAMADAIDRRPAGAVDILLAVRIRQIAALGPHDFGQGPVELILAGRAGGHGEIHLAKSRGVHAVLADKEQRQTMITVFDETQRLHAPRAFIVSGKPQPSPERPERIDMLLQGVKRIGSTVVAPPAITMETVALVHEQRYLDFLETLWSAGRIFPMPAIFRAQYLRAGPGDPRPRGYPESVVGQAAIIWAMAHARSPHNLEAALASAASAAHGARLVLGGEKLVYALCRPPGHHAAADVAAGFCYFNNSAIAAEILTRAGKRTAILDIDVHHGNGTEAIFYDRADVLTVSIHADPKRFYPFFWGYARRRGGERARASISICRWRAEP